MLQFLVYTAFTSCNIALEVVCTSTTVTTNNFCTNDYKIIYFASIFSVVTDFYVLLLPIHKVSSLQLSPRRKVGVLFIFVTGIL